MDYEEFEDFINSLKNFKNKFSFRENGFNIDYFSNSDEESDYSFWIAPYIVVQDSYNYTYNYQHDKNYYAEVSDIETDEFKSWINKIVDKLKNSQVKKIVSNNAGDLSIYWENDYILNVLLNDLEESFLYFYDYINLKSYHFSLSKIEIRELASRNSHRLERELMQILNFKGYDKNIIDKIKKEVIEINNERLNNLLISIYHEKSTDLSSLAYIKEGKESQDLYQKLFNKYQEIIDINPKSSDTYFSWGYNLVLFAEKVELEQAFPLYQEAIQKYQKVIEIEADSDAAFNNIGNIFADLAQLEENDKEVEFLYNKAFENYKKAIEINPNKYKSFYNWAMFLGDLAEFKAQNSSFFAEEKEAESLYKQAFKKYEKALEIKPEDYNSLYNWANNLSNFASIKEGKKI